jgi:hypothetical protein
MRIALAELKKSVQDTSLIEVCLVGGVVCGGDVARFFSLKSTFISS